MSAKRTITLPDGTKLATTAAYAHLAESPDWDGKCCSATKAGKRCGQPAMRGQIVCKMHGGKTPKALAAASNRLHRAAIRGQIGDMLAQYEELVPDGMDPLTGLLEVVTRTWLMARVYGDLVAELASHTTATVERVPQEKGAPYTDVRVTEAAVVDPDHLGDLRTHPLVDDYRRWLSEHARACKLALDAGVEERQIQLAERQARNIVSAVQAALDALELTAEQAAKAPQVVANLLRAVAGGGRA